MSIDGEGVLTKSRAPQCNASAGGGRGSSSMDDTAEFFLEDANRYRLRLAPGIMGTGRRLSGVFMTEPDLIWRGSDFNMILELSRSAGVVDRIPLRVEMLRTGKIVCRGEGEASVLFCMHIQPYRDP